MKIEVMGYGSWVMGYGLWVNRLFHCPSFPHSVSGNPESFHKGLLTGRQAAGMRYESTNRQKGTESYRGTE